MKDENKITLATVIIDGILKLAISICSIFKKKKKRNSDSSDDSLSTE